MAGVAEVQAPIQDMVRAVRINACVPTMRSALLLWQQYLADTKLSGLSADDERAYRAEQDRVRFLLDKVFPEYSSDTGGGE